MLEPSLMGVDRSARASAGVVGSGSLDKKLGLKTVKPSDNQTLIIGKYAGKSIANKLSGDYKNFGVKEDSQGKVATGEHFPRGTRVSLTIDHLYDHGSKTSTKGNERLLKRITEKGAHVTLFIGCRDNGNGCEKDLIAANKLQQINPDLIHIRPHSSAPSPDLQRRAAIMGALTQGIQKIEPETKNKSMSGSRHGAKSQWNRLTLERNGLSKIRETTGGSVIPNGASVSSVMKLAKKHPNEGLVFWSHAHEIKQGSHQDKVLEEFLIGIQSGRYQSLPY